MASIILSTVGRAVGTYLGGPIGGQLGAQLGATIGAQFSGSNKRHFEGARLESLAVQTSTYGRMIPIVFGSVRIAGNMIWSLPLKELATTTQVDTGGKGGGGSSPSSSSTSTTYSYYSTMAIAVCEGEITSIDRVWADSELLDLSQGTYRIYKGDEAQLPDPLIESYEGVGATPAYRGIAYVVMEDFPLADFGNRIPNFTFEVTRRVSQIDADDTSVESMVTSIMLIPGSGEFVYDTQTEYKIGGTDASGNFVQTGYQVAMNQHTPEGKANVEVALDDLQVTFPNLEWVGIAVNWFGSDMDIGHCSIWPCVEYQDGVSTTPNAWSVAGFLRATARLIGSDGGSLRYGGTPSDDSILRLLTSLQGRGLKIFFYPQMLMDIEGKPWRGNLTGSASAVSHFFHNAQGYNNFILHYANLVAGQVDAFAIGTEMRDLNKITHGTGMFPAVSEFVSLAHIVKGTLGTAPSGDPILVTYAADWSEYHHTDGGWYHLDPLWASHDIDMVGIDAYFPLADAPQAGYDVDAIRAGWTSGEGYDWYYTDADRTIQAPLSPPYAWKNIDWWWNNHHVNPDGSHTAWVPHSKPVWFTEYGYASVDGCANEPNVFVDSSSSESAYPRFSRGLVDFMAQRTAITATETQWAGSSMVQRQFLWTWDARPYPYWPDLLDVWSDGGNWVTGHWVQGKLGASHVAGALEELMQRAGLTSDQVDMQQVQAILDGFVLNERVSTRAAIDQLMQAFFFTIKDSGGQLVAFPFDTDVDVSVAATACVPKKIDDQQVAYVLDRQEDLVLPARVEVQFLDRLQSYETSIESAERSTQEATDVVTTRLSLVLSETHARTIAQQQLTNSWSQRTSISLQLPIAYAALEPGDLLELTDGALTYRVRLNKVQIGRPGIVRISGVLDASQVWDGYISPVEGSDGSSLRPKSLTRFEVLDIPALPSDAQDSLTLRIAVCGISDGWTGASITRLLDDGNERRLLTIATPAVIGTALTALPDGATTVFDRVNTIDISLLGTAVLSNATEASVLNGANVAVLGNEIIQFANATQISDGVYRLDTLLRGRLGTEQLTDSHAIGDRFVLLNEAVIPMVLPADVLGQAWNLRATTFGDVSGQVANASLTIAANSLMPYSPVDIEAVRDGTGDVTISWIRRTRIDGGLRDYIDVPLKETTEEYEVSIYDGSALKRRWRVTSPTTVYASADQVTDFGTPPASIHITLTQISALVGPGKLADMSVIVAST